MLLSMGPTLGLLPLLMAATARAADTAKCYRLDGQIDDQMMPCDPTAQASTCCRKTDLCLSNGLCLGGGNTTNAFSQQGCTNKDWSSPCHAYCPGEIVVFSDGFQYLAQCSGFDATQAGFCCGGDFNCCTDIPNLIKTIPKFTALSHPPGAASTSTSVGANATGKPTTSASAASAVTSTNSPSVGAKSSGSSNATVVGASVGVSLGVALLGLVGLLVWQKRKHKRTTMKKTYNEMTTPRPSSPFTVYARQQPKDMIVELPSSGPVELPATRHS